MKSACQLVGVIVLALWLLASLNVIDLYVCVGKRDACIPNEAVKSVAI